MLWAAPLRSDATLDNTAYVDNQVEVAPPRRASHDARETKEEP